jgi:hypothetical protein
MSETGLPKFPEGPRIGGQIPRSAPEVILGARLIGIPNGIKASDRLVILKGEVVAQGPNNTVRIQTDRGAIDLQIDPERAKAERIEFKLGQRVEIEIPPDRSQNTPQENQIVILRPAPERAQIQTNAEIPAEISTAQNTKIQTSVSPQVSATRLSETPVDITLSPRADLPPLPPEPDLTAALPQQTLEQVLSVGTIRLDPLPPALVSQIIQPPITSITATVLPPAPLQNSPTVLLDIPDTPISNAAQIFVTAPKPAEKIISDLFPLKSDVKSAQLPNFLAPNAETPTSGSPQKPLTELLSIPITKPLLQVRISPFGNPEGAIVLKQGIANFTPAPDKTFSATINSIAPPDTVLVEPGRADNAAVFFAQKTTQPESGFLMTETKIGTLPAKLEGFTAKNIAILSLPAFGIETSQTSFFLLQTAIDPQAVAQGSILNITPQTQIQTSILPQTPLPPAASFLTAEPWPLLQDISQTLQMIAPQAAQNLNTVLPSPANPAQMTPAALFVMAAIKGGDLSNILSDRAIDSLRRDGRGHLSNRLSQEGSLINRLSSDQAPSADWRAMTLPMVWDGDIYKIALYYKQEKEQDEQGQSGGKQTRFIFDLAFNRMGKIQLDGLFRAARLDMIIRSEAPLSPAMQQQMRRDYLTALELTQLHGELNFQNKPEQWVKIEPAQRAAHKSQFL